MQLGRWIGKNVHMVEKGCAKVVPSRGRKKTSMTEVWRGAQDEVGEGGRGYILPGLPGRIKNFSPGSMKCCRQVTDTIVIIATITEHFHESGAVLGFTWIL